MAIAGLVVTVDPSISEEMATQLSAQVHLVDVQISHDPSKLVVVLEISADKVKDEIQALQEIENILAVDIAYINYEDDIEEKGEVPCPVHISKFKPT